MFFRRISLFILSVCLLSVGHAQVNYQALNQYIAKARIDFGVTGMAVGVVKDQDIIFQNGYGVQNIQEPGTKVTTYSNFMIASISKSFTATGMAMLVEEGKLNWNDKVTKHLPYFELNDPVITSLLTIEDLLCHRSGLATFDGDLLWYGTGYSQEEILRRIQHRPLSREFRDEFGYQNIMYIAAAQVIEKVSGQTWGEFMRTRFFRPLGMQNTTADFNTFKNGNKIAYPHIDKEKIEFIDYNNAWGAAGIHTSVTDVSKWMRFLLSEGTYQGDSITSAKSIRETFSAKLPLAPGKFDRENGIHFKAYGLGWFMFDYEGKKILHHGGGLPGYISKIVLVPEENLGFIVLTNDMSSLPTALMYKLLDEFLGKRGKKKDWAEDFLAYQQSEKEADEMYKKQLEEKYVRKPEHSVEEQKFVGMYEDKLYGMAEIKLDKKKLVITLLPSKNIFTGIMEPWYKDGFKIVFKDKMLPAGLVNFKVEDNVVSGFTIDLPNPDFHFHKLNFEKLN